MRFLRPLPRPLARVLTVLVLLAWCANMAVLVRETWLRSNVALAADIAGYSQAAQWRGIYYRGDKIGFSVGQTTASPSGYVMREDGRLQMTLLGASTAVRLSSRADVDAAFRLRSFSFSLDPGTGATEIAGTLDGTRLRLTIRTPSGERNETRALAEVPSLALNLPRALVARGLQQGDVHTVSVFDPATLRNAPMRIEVQAREIVRAAGVAIPAFRIEGTFAGVRTRSWITDVGEIVREESPMGLLVVRETAEQAQALAVPGALRADLLEAAAIAPKRPLRIDDPTTVARLSLRLTGLEALAAADLDGDGQSFSDGVFQVIDPRDVPASPRPAGLEQHLRPEPLLESDAPEIVAQARMAAGDARAPRLEAERLLRHVHALIEKRPTISLPSALEVLKTKVGDCNEHTALYVAMARSLGLPARVSVGLVQLRGAFYYHAWAEVWIEEAPGRGRWQAVDPTLNQFPADATHVRLARGGLDKQAAIMGMIGNASIDVLDVQLRPGAVPVLVGRAASDLRPLDIALPRRERGGCWSSPGKNR